MASKSPKDERIGTPGTSAGKVKNVANRKVIPEQIAQQYTDEFNDRASQSLTQQGVEDTVWKVGCYKINPSTPSGQKFFILHMLVLPLIPITALVIQNSVTMNTLLGYQSRVKTIRNQVSISIT